MKKLALALIAISATLFGFGMVAQAQYGGGSGTIVFTPPNPTPGQLVTGTITGCTPGEVLTITLNGTVIGTATCVATPTALTTGAILGLLLPQQTGTGQATLQFRVPTSPGSYTVAVTGTQGYTRSVTLVIAAPAAPPATPAAGGLPATGSGGINTTMTAAAGLFAVGLGLLGVTLIRRRQTPSPA